MIEYTLRRSDRARHTRLTIRPDGEVVVTLPSRAPERWAIDLVRARADWIDRHQARIAAARDHLAARPSLGAGRGISLGGLEHTVEVVPLGDGRRRSRVVHDDTEGPRIRLELAAEEGREPVAILEAWLRGEAREVILASRGRARAGSRGPARLGRHPRPAQPMGERLATRHALLQLAPGDDAGGGPRLRRRPRAGTPAAVRPRAGVLAHRARCGAGRRRGPALAASHEVELRAALD